MSDNPPEPGADETDRVAESGQEFEHPLRTGVEEVDAVLDDVDGLEGTPVEEHPRVFEDAHDRLRGALDGRPDA